MSSNILSSIMVKEYPRGSFLLPGDEDSQRLWHMSMSSLLHHQNFGSLGLSRGADSKGFVFFYTYWKTSAVSTTNGWLKLNFASCVIRQTRLLGALVLCSMCNMVFVNCIYDMVVDTQFHKFYGRPLARDIYGFLMKDIGRWLPLELSGSTGWFYINDVVHNV